MRFLLDQNVYACTARLLVAQEHDVLVVSAIALAGATDMDLILKARELNRIFVTRDRDFGNLVFIKNVGVGVLYLRMLPSTQEAVHQELCRVLINHSEYELKSSFVVIEPGRHRIRQIGKARNA